MRLSQTGKTPSEVFSLLETKIASQKEFSTEKIFTGAFPTPEVEDLLKEANKMFFWANALSPLSFPSLKKYEAEVVAFLIDLMHGDEEKAGNMTTGSDENILMTLKVARDYCRETKPHIKNPEVIIPRTAHPAFLKAAHYFNIKIQTVSLDENFLPNLTELQKLINPNTILIVGSAPCSALGIIDPIEKMGEIAHQHDILFHVDANVGGMVLPFLKPQSAISCFDFRARGVTSISIDLYYGMGPKGAGVMLYRDKHLRKHQYFTYSEYPGGLYGSPSLTGSRAGGPIAAAWALLQFLGRKRFEEIVNEITSPLAPLQRRGEVQIVGKPVSNIFAFTCSNVDTVHEQLLHKGWYLEKLSLVPALRMQISPIHKNSIAPFLTDLDSILHAK